MKRTVTVLPPEPAEGTAYALIFAVENYLEDKIGRVSYAENDANAITEALLGLGYDEANIQLTVNTAATMVSIRYAAKQLARTAKLGDTVFFFFAGHGYTWQGQNYLMSYDTRRDDIENTAISLQELFNLFAKSECKQVMFFLDCCHSGMHLGDEERGVLEDFSTDELRSYFKNADFCVVFSACDKGEKSYPSIQYKHGYWTYHLLRALRGEEPDLLDDAGLLRSTSLQDYLRVDVPKQLALQSTTKRSQSPKMFGDVSGTFVVADLGALLARLAAERKAEAVGLKDSTLRRLQTGPVSELSGFDKARNHKPPTHVSRTTQGWVARLAHGDLEIEMGKYFQKIRDAKVYKRKELQYDPPTDGGAAIRTPDFAFSITYSQSEEDPSEYEVVQELTRLDNPDLLDEEWFNELFRRTFDEAVIEFSGQLNVEDFIDAAEDMEDFEVEYDPEATYCTITFKGFYGTITVTAESLKYEFRRAETPREMALQLQSASALLLGMSEIQKFLPL
jgi:hypothetical protein